MCKATTLVLPTTKSSCFRVLAQGHGSADRWFHLFKYLFLQKSEDNCEKRAHFWFSRHCYDCCWHDKAWEHPSHRCVRSRKKNANSESQDSCSLSRNIHLVILRCQGWDRGLRAFGSSRCWTRIKPHFHIGPRPGLLIIFVFFVFVFFHCLMKNPRHGRMQQCACLWCTDTCECRDFFCSQRAHTLLGTVKLLYLRTLF